MGARTVGIAGFGERLHDPKVMPRYRKARRAIAFHFAVTEVFKNSFGARHVGKKLCAGLAIGPTVIRTVRGKLVAHPNDLADHARMALGNPAKREEGRTRIGLRQKLKNAIDVGLDSA